MASSPKDLKVSDLTLDHLESGFNTRMSKVPTLEREDLWTMYVGQVMLAQDVMKRGANVLSSNDSPAVVLGNAAALLYKYGWPEQAQQMVDAVGELRFNVPKIGFHVRKEEEVTIEDRKSWMPSLKELKDHFDARMERDAPTNEAGQKLSTVQMNELWMTLVGKVCFAVDVMRRGREATMSDAPPAVVLGQAAALLKKYNFKEAANRMLQEVSNLPDMPPAISFSDAEQALLGGDSYLAPAASDDFEGTEKARRAKKDSPTHRTRH